MTPGRLLAAALLALPLGVAGLTGGAREASAYACYEPGLLVSPLGDDAPTNAIVRIRFPQSVVSVQRSGPQGENLASARVEFASAQIRIRSATGITVPSKTQVLPTTFLPSLAIIPLTKLEPKSKLEVVVREGGEDFVIQTFTTGDGPDVDAPTAEAIESAHYYRIENPGYKEMSGPYARIRIRGGSDGASGPLAYEVHALDEGPEATLRAIVQPHDGAIVFGHASLCEPIDYRFAEKGKLRLGIRPVDRTGRSGPMLETTLDLSKPEPIDRGK